MIQPIQKKTSFVDQIASSRGSDIYLVRGKDTTDRQAWYYVLVERTKKRAFEAREGTPNLKLTDFGTILHSGYGQNPPEDIVQKMFDEYGFKEA